MFAFVGSFSLNDDCGADVLKGSGIPDVHNALGPKSAQLDHNYSVAPLPTGWRTGPLNYYKAKYGTKFSHVGAVYADLGGAALTWRGTAAAIKNVGGNVDYERGFKPTETDFTADVVRMRRRGVQMHVHQCVDATTFARVAKAMRSRTSSWPIIVGGAGYDPSFSPRPGLRGEGMFNDAPFAQFFDGEDAGAIPEVKRVPEWSRR